MTRRKTAGETLFLATKASPAGGLCTRPNGDNLSDGSPLTPEIDCKLTNLLDKITENSPRLFL